MNPLLRILVVEDSEVDFRLLVNFLRKQGVAITAQRVDCGETMAAALEKEPWDVVISDCYLPQFNAKSALTLCQKMVVDIPFIVTSGVMDELQAVELLKAGAHDFVSKANYSRLLPAIQRELREVEERRQRRQAENALRESEQKFHTLASHAPVGIFYTDATGQTLLYTNAAWEKMTGLGAGEGLTGAIHPEDRDTVHAEWLRGVAQGDKFNSEFRFQRPDGTVVWVVAQGTPHWGEDGRVLGCVGTATDITEYKHIQEKLQHAIEVAESANCAKTEFLAAMSHEIRTPMNAILGMAEMLAEHSGDNEETRHFTTIILRNGEVLLTLLNDILDITKSDLNGVTLNAQEFDLQKLVDGVIGSFQLFVHEKKQALSGFVDSHMSTLRIGDEVRIRQVLSNLMGNAVKFTEQGQIHLAVSQSQQEGQGVEFSVSDSGIGIPTEMLDTVFGLFQQGDGSLSRKYGGAGMGLYIAKTLVNQMGGQLQVESKVGLGSCFHFSIELPISPPVGDQSPVEKLSLDIHALAGKRVLLADDAEDNVALFKVYLAKTEMSIDVAENGQEAVEMFKAKAHDLVIMDIQMPIMDGLTATRAIRAWEAEHGLPATPILAVTAFTLEGDGGLCFAAGCSGYLSKPVKKAALIEGIQCLLAQPRDRDHPTP